MKKCGLCIVGCGKSFSYHDSHIFSVFKDIDCHFVDENPDALPNIKSGQFKGCTTSTELPDDNFDLAVICTPNGTHRDIAQHFIDNHIPVFIEKPPALTGEDIEWLEEAERNGAWITVGFQARFATGLVKIREATKGRRLYHINSWKYRSRGADYYEDEWHGRWKTDGGVICQQGIHCVDAICSLTEEVPEWVSMVGANHLHDIECEDTASLFIKFPSFTANVNCTTALTKGGKAGSEVISEVGVLRAEGFAWDKITYWNSYEPEPKIPGGSAAYTIMWQHIKEALDTNNSPPIPLIDAARSMRIVHAGYASWRSGKPESYGVWFNQLGR